MNNYIDYINNIKKLSSEVLKNILEEQSKQGLNLDYPKNKANVLLMIADSLLSLNGNTDLNFGLIIHILEDEKVWNIFKSGEKYESILQKATLHNNLPLLFSIFIKRYSKLPIHTFSEDKKISEMTTLMNVKCNLDNDGEEFFEKFILPFINVIIFFEANETDMLKINLSLLFENLNNAVEKEDFIYISDYIFKLFNKKNILR